ncbi:hypothetical protein [uncultured Microbacterium sp.]|uniref:leucine-rich repeat domain-containing protein n=1 Tax=uncultured Microbacterium sp. TaxID=191216 RepID=UPI00261F5933|nr:hypothetical protein [uncultured Microbacterium sp.]
MAALAGIAAFFVALFLSYQIFPDPGTGDMEYAGGRFIFTIAVTVVVSVVASKASKNRREEQERREAELEREQELAKREAKRRRIQDALDREEARRSAALADAKSRVDHLRALLQRREQQRRDSGYRHGRHAFGVVSDEFLANIVWERLHTPWDERSTITAEQMESLTGDLYISTYRNQRRELNLEGMQYATNIDALSLNPIDDEVDLSPIAGLANLRRLEIRGGKGISSIDAIATLDGLQHLALAHLANVKDFRPLAGLERLARLELTSMSDALEFDSISGLTGLAKLEVGHMGWFTDLSGISNVRQLRELVLYSTGDLEDLSALAKLSRLEGLWFDRMHIRGLRKIRNLSTLKSLTLRDVSGVADLEALSNLGQLAQLELTGVRLDPYKYEGGALDLGPLSSLSTLRKVKLIQGDGYTSFANWDAISLTRGLVELEVAGDLYGTNALDAISHLDHLETLRISSATMPDLKPLSALARLERLEIEGEWIGDGPTHLHDLETLAGLPRLHTLVIDTCEGWRLLRDVGQFHGLTHLELKNCKLAHEYEDLDSLANLTRLESLVLRENSNLVRDVSPLEHLSRLTSLTLVSKSYESPWDTSRLEQTEGLTISTR